MCVQYSIEEVVGIEGVQFLEKEMHDFDRETVSPNSNNSVAPKQSIN